MIQNLIIFEIKIIVEIVILLCIFIKYGIIIDLINDIYFGN